MRERTSLVERMEQARARTVAARAARDAPVAPESAGARPDGHGAPHRPPGPSWVVAARPGEELLLLPGQMHFGGAAGSIRTLLGSCVAVTLWHPRRRLGGMCHFLLPARAQPKRDAPDGRFGDDALEAMVRQLRLAGTEPQEYEAHLYGGADTFPEGTNLAFNVGARNIEQGWRLIERFGFQLQGVDVGENVPRTVTLVLATGAVDMRRGVVQFAQAPVASRILTGSAT